MKRTMLAGLAVLVLGLGVWHFAFAQDTKSKGRALTVKLHYTGSGAVDEKHKILTFLFPSGDFMRGEVPPMAMKDTASKDGTVTFTEVEKSPVYVGCVYDPSGNYDGQSPPPSGSSLGAYMSQPGEAKPVELEEGKTVEIEITFDDSVKMP